MSVRLFVGNLAYGVTEADLKALFSAAGAVTQVRIPTDRETGKPRGFAFVDFGDRAHAEDAIRRFNQHVFQERALAVNEARTREARPAAGPGTGTGPRSGAPPVARPAWHGPSPAPAPEEAQGKFDQPRRTFGPDASARDKRKQKGRASREERGPKGALRERGGGQLFLGEGFEDPGDDPGVDDFALWAHEDASKQDEE
jgi:RNA recognition motif-containing protein